MSQTPARTFPLDPQFKTVMSNYLSSRPYNEVNNLIETLNKDEPVDVQFIQQLGNSLVKEVPVRLYIAVQQVLNSVQQQQQPQRPQQAPGAPREGGPARPEGAPSRPEGGRPEGGRPRPRPRQRQQQQETEKPETEQKSEETTTESS